MSTQTRTYFYQGIKVGWPFIFLISPFAFLFGVVAMQAGLNVFEALSFSVIVIAGAAQLTAIQLMQENTHTFVIIFSGLAVNLRMAMYSASMAVHMGKLPLWKRALVAYLTVDQTYAVSIAKFETEPEMSVADKFAFYIGVATPILPLWYLATLAGAWTGSAVPSTLPLDFAIPLTFIAIITPMLRTLPHVIATCTSVVLSLALAFIPFNFGVILAGICAMIAGAASEEFIKNKGRVRREQT